MEDVFRLLLSAILAAVIGIDREKRHKAAGIRTNIIVSVTSCLIMMLSVKVSQTTFGADPGRIAAQVISGIGFLGAGTILKQEDKIEGLTTAASLWGVSGLGLAIGYGYYLGAVAAGVIIFFNLLISIGKKIRNEEA